MEAEDGAIGRCGAVAHWQAKDRTKLALCDEHKRQADAGSKRPRGFRYLGELSDASQS